MDDILDGNDPDIPTVTNEPAQTTKLSTNEVDDTKEKDIDIGFLFASPIVLENHFPGQKQELVEFPQISWKKELKLIKDEVRKKELRMKIEASVATTQKLIDMLKKSMRVLHISCHGIKDSNNSIQKISSRPRMSLESESDPVLESNYLLFETPTGEGELVDALQISKILKQGVPQLIDLVVL